LKAEASNPEAPDRKAHKVAEDSSEEFDAKDVPGMFRALMQQMKSVAGAVEQASSMAREAKQSALEAKGAVQAVEMEVGRIKDEMKDLKEVGIRAAVEDIIKGGAAVQVQAHAHGIKAGTDNHDKWRRTVGFGPFPDDTKSVDIIKFIEGVIADMKGDVEEVYAYGKKFAERGAARFKSEEAMWAYMRGRSGKHMHEYEGVKVYCNVDSRAKDPNAEDVKRERAVRKVVRAIIETNGGDGFKTKKEIDANYKKGIVWWKDKRVATWKDGQMELSEEAAPWKAQYTVLMRAE
jgi:hypothetical protein